MPLVDCVTGLQHIGIPTNDIEKTIEFYTGLGFSLALRTKNEAANEAVAFLSLQNIMIETYQTPSATKKAGAIDHFAMDVSHVQSLFEELKGKGYSMLHSEVQFLPFWEHGVKFFTIEGPNAEKIEFSQML